MVLEAGGTHVVWPQPNTHFLKSDHLAELKPWDRQAGFLLLCRVLASKPSKRLERSQQKSKNTLCESSSFIKKDQRSNGFGLFFFLVFSGASLGASYLALLSVGCLWGAFGVPCGFL